MSDERKASLAVFLSIIVILVWTNLFMTPPPAPTKDVTTPEVAAPATSQPVKGLNSTQADQLTAATNAPAVAPSAPVLTKNTNPTVDDYFASQKIKIETPKITAQLSALGGRLLNFKLKDYLAKVDTDILIDMVRPEGNSFPLGVEIGGFNDAAVQYRLVGVSNGATLTGPAYELKAGQNASFNLEGLLPDGRTISKVISFQADSYLFDVTVKLSAATADGSKIKLNWIEDLPSDFKEDRYNIKSFIYLEQDKSLTREYVNDDAQAYPEQFVKWVGLGDNYFTVNLFSPGPFTPVNFESKYVGEIHRLDMKATGDTQSGEFKIYAGPKTPAVLKEVGFDLHRNIDLGWFSFIGQPLLAFIQFWFGILGNYGLAIIIVTIFIKLCLLPLTKKSYLSMKAMQDLQPKVKALRERIKDPKQLQVEMMKVYQENGVNPMGGCLPMVLQVPVFLGMYNALQSSIYLRHADFALWVNDLSAPERLMLFGIPVPFMILLMGLSMFGQTMLTPTTADPQQKKIMYIMPIMFTFMFIIYPFPSGLVLYWLVNNIMSIIQQYSIRTERNIQPLQATIVAGVVVFAIGYVVTLI